jgi:hypothetical protein
MPPVLFSLRADSEQECYRKIKSVVVGCFSAEAVIVRVAAIEFVVERVLKGEPDLVQRDIVSFKYETITVGPVCGFPEGETCVPVLFFMDPRRLKAYCMYSCKVLILGVKGQVRKPVGRTALAAVWENVCYDPISAGLQIMLSPLMLESDAPVRRKVVDDHVGLRASAKWACDSTLRGMVGSELRIHQLVP